MSKIIHITSNFLQGIILALVVVSGSLFIAGRMGLAAPFSAYVILSGSMAPALPVGSVVVTQQQTSYVPGDIITFKKPGEKIAVSHRVVSETSDGFSTKGDANKTPDTGTIVPANITGKVLLTIPYLGYIVEFAKSPKGFLALIVIPATIIIYEELKIAWYEVRTWLRKKKESTVEAMRYPIIAVLMVVVAAAFLFTATSGSFFLDNEKTQGNYLGAAASYVSPTPTLTPSPTPLP